MNNKILQSYCSTLTSFFDYNVKQKTGEKAVTGNKLIFFIPHASYSGKSYFVQVHIFAV